MAAALEPAKTLFGVAGKSGTTSARSLELFGLVPGTYYSFGVLKQAQALGDFKALTEAGQDIVHLHLESASVDPVAAIESLLRVRVGAH